MLAYFYKNNEVLVEYLVLWAVGHLWCFAGLTRVLISPSSA